MGGGMGMDMDMEVKGGWECLWGWGLWVGLGEW